ncbi:hypothetical protein ACFL2R_04000 [Patescibacteria group bacterium]
MDKDRCRCRRGGKVRLLLLLILGFLMGVMLKGMAMERISMGFDDPNVKAYAQGYDFEEISQRIENEKMNTDMSDEE